MALTPPRAQAPVLLGRWLGKFGQDVLWNVGSLGIMGVCGVVLNLIIAWAYRPEVLGSFNQVYALYIVVSQFAVIGLHLSALKYVAQYAADRAAYRSITTTAMVLAAGFAALAAVLTWLARDAFGVLLHSPGVAVGLACAAPGLFFFSINKVSLSILNGLSRLRAYAVFQSLRYLLMIGVLALLAAARVPGEYLPLVFSVAEGALFIALLPAIAPEMGRPASEAWRPWIRAHLVFGVRGFLSNVLLEFNTRVDVLVLGIFTDERTVGIYSLAAIVAEGIYQLPIVLRTVYNPLLVQLIAAPDMAELKRTVARGARWTYAAMLGVGGLAVLAYPVALRFLTNKPDYAESWPIFVILMAGIVLASGYIPFGNLLLQAGRPGLHTIMVGCLVGLNLAGNLILVPRFGPAGSAVATALSFVASVALIKWFARTVLKTRL